MRKSTQISVRDTFTSNAPDNLMLPGYTEPGVNTPSRDPSYVFGPELAIVLAWFSTEQRDGLFLSGPTRCGKTSLIREICARSNQNLYEVDGHQDMEVPDLIGHYINIGGDLIWQDGELTLAMREGCPFCLNEIDAIDPGVLIKLHKILEGRALTIDDNGGEIVPRQKGFRFIATGNTNGRGNRSGEYAGTVQQNAAFMERFWVVKMDYLEESIEVELLTKQQKIAHALAKRMRDVAAVTRGQHTQQYAASDTAVVEIPMSTHSLLRWARIAKMIGMGGMNEGSVASRALDVAYANRLEEESRDGVHGIVQRIFATS